ncbi:hypothetical protein DEM91_05610 [Prevotella sp. TCVGH]|nr:hypothetical protein [Prevotella sp. TCVGH]
MLVLLLKSDILTMKNIKNIVSVKLKVHWKKEELMLNFLYKVPLKTRVKTTNGNVGRKYANYEQLS